MESRSIPIFVESIKCHEEFSMTRCNYLAIETDTPIPSTLTIQKKKIPILLLGMQALIMKPVNGNYFKSVEQIEEVINAFENSKNDISITVDDIWLPNFLFENDWNESSNKNQVYRVNTQLFSSAYKFRVGTISQTLFEEESQKLSNQIQYSTQEHKAFGLWHEKTIEYTRQQYRERKERDKSLVLKSVRQLEGLGFSRDRDDGLER